jgi:sulfur carrier protein
MMTIRFQDELLRVTQGCALSEVLLKQGYNEGCFAIAVNRQFVPRDHYVAVFLQENDLVEIVMPMQGG